MLAARDRARESRPRTQAAARTQSLHSARSGGLFGAEVRDVARGSWDCLATSEVLKLYIKGDQAAISQLEDGPFGFL